MFKKQGASGLPEVTDNIDWTQNAAEILSQLYHFFQVDVFIPSINDFSPEP